MIELYTETDIRCLSKQVFSLSTITENHDDTSSFASAKYWPPPTSGLLCQVLLGVQQIFYDPERMK